MNSNNNFLTDAYNVAKAQKTETNRPDVKTLQMQSSLYETGLQNVFNNYQKNIGTLDDAKKQQIQDAYVIREMSKKYLGEFASEKNIGNVSGDLLQIYGDYQKNIGAIESNYDTLKLGLDETYQQQSWDNFTKLIETNYNLDLAKLVESEQKSLYKLATGDYENIFGEDIPENVTPKMALEQLYKQGEVSDETYRAVSLGLMQEKANEVYTNLSTGVYGTDDEGNLISDPYQYLEKVKGELNKEDYNKIIDSLNTNTALSSMAGFTHVTNPSDTENYIGSDVSYELLQGVEKNVKIGSGSYGIKDSAGNLYFSSNKEIGSSGGEFYYDGEKISTSDIESEFLATKGEGQSRAFDGDYIDMFVTDKGDKNGRNVRFMVVGGKWKEMVQAKTYTSTEMKQWVSGNKSKTFKIDKDGNFIMNQYADKKELKFKPKKDTTIKITELVNSNRMLKIPENADPVIPKVIETFKKAHGDAFYKSGQKMFVVSDGRLFAFERGKLTEYKK